MNPFDRTYGVEIECYLPEGKTHAMLAAAITAANVGAPCVVEIYNHQTRNHWKLVTDGSLQNYERGVEVVSPKLSGPEGMASIMKVCAVLDAMGCTVSQKCGIHCHVNSVTMGTPAPTAAPLTLFKNLFKAYAGFEPVIDAFMPPSRRGNAAYYARSLVSVPFYRIDQATGFNHFLGMLPGGGSDETRRLKVNYLAYNRHRTVEFRQHSGTTDGAKICKWAMFCLRMVAAAAMGAIVLPEGSNASVSQLNQARRFTKVWSVGELLLRPEGVTQREALDATGWLKISMPATARACGLTITSSRTGRITRYFARAAQAAVGNLTFDQLMNMLQMTTEERDYFRARTDRLSGRLQQAA